MTTVKNLAVSCKIWLFYYNDIFNKRDDRFITKNFVGDETVIIEDIIDYVSNIYIENIKNDVLRFNVYLCITDNNIIGSIYLYKSYNPYDIFRMHIDADGEMLIERLSYIGKTIINGLDDKTMNTKQNVLL
jgi:hypothetical protein